MISVRIHLTARCGKQTELFRAVGDLCRKIAGETGCISCQFYQNPENVDELVVIEEWKHETTARAHLKSENLALLVGASSVLTQKISVVSGKDLSTRNLNQSFRERIIRDPLRV
jgi:quinol monooxygenase YgiN